MSELAHWILIFLLGLGFLVVAYTSDEREHPWSPRKRRLTAMTRYGVLFSLAIVAKGGIG